MLLASVKNTLYGKLAAVLLGLFCLVSILFLTIARFSVEMYQLEIAQKLNRDLASHIASEIPPMQGGRANKKALYDIFHQIMIVNPSIEIYLLDAQGRILAFSAPPEKVKRQSVALSPIEEFLRHDAEFPIVGDDPRRIAGSKIFSAAAIPARAQPDGYLYIILGGEEYDSIVQRVQGSYILKLGVSAVLAILLFALLAGLMLFTLLTRRLSRLTATVESFRQNDFIHEPPIFKNARHPDEIDRLGQAFHQMSARIAQQLQRLRDTDKLRRELVANISHDLRTPLASIQGYLETLLLKHDSLTPEERRHYLEIAGKHSERLGKLVAELFELAKLESNEIQLHRERFPIAELIQDVAQEFHLAAEKKKINLEVRLQENSPVVFADIGLLARVFANLIENALRYTPAGGTVRLSLSVEEDKVCVRLSDTGCGIPPEEIPYIFDRFHRLEKNTGTSSDGAGLGLAIAKRILELHGSAIEADSTVNAGTTFSFQLPIDKT